MRPMPLPETLGPKSGTEIPGLEDRTFLYSAVIRKAAPLSVVAT